VCEARGMAFGCIRRPGEMITRQLMCVCLLLSILTGCGKRPPLGLPTSDWTTSEPISGYQWYIDGKPEGERRAIEKTSRLLLTGATIDGGGFITWALQVAPGESNTIGSGRIRVDPTNPPKLSWPPSGSLPIDNRTCIFRIEQEGSRPEIRELFVYSMPSAKTEQAGTADSGSADASPK
jgi:predicted small lipoprotein YifL